MTAVIVLQPGEYYGAAYDVGDTVDVSAEDNESIGRHIAQGNLAPTDIGAYAEAYIAQDSIDALVIREELQTIVAAAADWTAFQTAVAEMGPPISLMRGRRWA